RGLPPPAAADPDDVHGVHHGGSAARAGQRRRRRNAPCNGYRGVLRHARRHPVRAAVHTAVLLDRPPPHRRRAHCRGGGAGCKNRAGRLRQLAAPVESEGERMKPYILFIATALGLGGCAAGPEYTAPDTAEAAFHNAGDGRFERARIETAWWREFG